MNVVIVATKSCSHCGGLQKELDVLGVTYRKVFVEEAPDLVKTHQIRHSPNLIVDDEIKFRRLPTERELKECLGLSR